MTFLRCLLLLCAIMLLVAGDHYAVFGKTAFLLMAAFLLYIREEIRDV